MAKNVAVGIDLGTTMSAAAYVSAPGQTTMIRNREGALLTPSVVLFGEDSVTVGREAVLAAPDYPDRVADCAKRDLGSPAYHRPLGGKKIAPEVIESYILRSLREDIVQTVGEHFKAVITAPAYFNEVRRKLTQDAGQMAGFEVLNIANEPTAAALAFGEELGYLSARGIPKDEMNVLVYDLGGGTFDVTVIQLRPNDIRTLATEGDVRLGGRDWDQRLVDHAARAFLQRYGVDPRAEQGSHMRLFQAAAEAKHLLSRRDRAVIPVTFARHSLKLKVSRTEFEELTADLLERTTITTRDVVKMAGLDFDAITRVLMVGGSTRMPMVGHMLEEVTGITPDQGVNPDEAVARGAALYAGFLLTLGESDRKKSQYNVTDVNSHSLGIVGVDTSTNRKRAVKIIPRNTPLPATKKRRFVTKTTGQDAIVVQVVEGESNNPRECAVLGRSILKSLPADLPAGHPVEITFAFDRNGRLSVSAVVVDTSRQLKIEFQREQGLPPTRITHWRKIVASNGGLNNFDSLVDEVLNSDPSAFKKSSNRRK